MKVSGLCPEFMPYCSNGWSRRGLEVVLRNAIFEVSSNRAAREPQYKQPRGNVRQASIFYDTSMEFLLGLRYCARSWKYITDQMNVGYFSCKLMVSEFIQEVKKSTVCCECCHSCCRPSRMTTSAAGAAEVECQERLS